MEPRLTRTRSNTSNTSLEMCKDYISRPLPHYVTSGINTKAQQICIDTTLYTPVHMYVPCSYIYGTGGLRFSGSPTWNTENYFRVTIELEFPRLYQDSWKNSIMEVDKCSLVNLTLAIPSFLDTIILIIADPLYILYTAKEGPRSVWKMSRQ